MVDCDHLPFSKVSFGRSGVQESKKKGREIDFSFPNFDIFGTDHRALGVL